MSWAATAVAQAVPGSARLPCRGGRRRQQLAAAHHSSFSERSTSTSSRNGAAAAMALECSLRLAAVRAAEQCQALPLFADAFSAPALEAAAAQQAGSTAAAEAPDTQFTGTYQPPLGGVAAAGQAGQAPPRAAAAASTATASPVGPAVALLEGIDPAEAAREALATRFLDEQLLKAATIVNLERNLTQEYNQVVLLGDAFDTRPFRLPWPEGTVIFCVAPREAHAAADAAFKAQGARVPRGCLLRRVPADLAAMGAEVADADGAPAGFSAALERAGFRGDRLSAWVLQGLTCLGLGDQALAALLTDLCNMAAFDSLVAGLMPAMQRRQLDNLLASFGLLGAGVDFGVQTDWGRWEAGLALDPEGTRPWLFVAQQKRLSLQEMGIYEDHVAAAMDTDEDFDGHFS